VQLVNGQLTKVFSIRNATVKSKRGSTLVSLVDHEKLRSDDRGSQDLNILIIILLEFLSNYLFVILLTFMFESILLVIYDITPKYPRHNYNGENLEGHSEQMCDDNNEGVSEKH